MANTGISRIDDLMAGAPGVAPLGAGDPDRDAVGAIQDLLTGFGNRQLPDVRLPSHGTFGSMTSAAVQRFRSSQGLPDSTLVDSVCLAALARGNPSDPMACRSYIALALDVEVDEMTYLMTLTGLWEANARFALLNLNTDRAGLSFGVIQWAQRPGRLKEILTAFHDADGDRFSNTFGGEVAAAGSLAHVAKPNGGVDPASGKTTDPDFDLVAEPWISRFKAAGLDPAFQKVQVTVATADARSAFDQIKIHAPLITSQRGVGFVLDVANQHGTAGALSIYNAVFAAGMTESALLQAMRDESVRRVSAQFGVGSPEAQSTTSRRDWFLTTPVLKENPSA
ncbi:N-acetylmuramoyl-L-alanine amidase domain/peptidoglycan binding domain protein (fragment) [Candidatus Sulfopaludibacter sp. SbA3]